MEARRLQLLELGRGARRPYERDAAIHEVFRSQAERTPGATAVVTGFAELTYAQLDLRSNRLAHHLLALGAGPGTCVGVALERSVELPVALLGILKAGAAYVPLDSGYPHERLEFMLDDAGVTHVVTDSSRRCRLPSGRAAIVCVDEDAAQIAARSGGAPEKGPGATGLAYVMYTSGSTGRPKGVAIEHRGVVRLVRHTDYVEISPGDVLLHAAPLAFDASTFEIWGALLCGARLAIPRPGLLSIAETCEAVERFGVTTMFLTPSLFQRLVDGEPTQLGRLTCLVLGGDVVPTRHANRFLVAFPNCRLVNGYGPTENTTFSTCYDIERDVRGSVPIGRPIANSTAYVLDERMEPVPVGVAGELYVGGDGVARGYVNLPELTAERFVPDPFSDRPPATLYKTGDRARLRPDGVLEFLGRGDGQVKVRGFRVEVTEIESALRTHPAVAEAAVVATQYAREKALFGYVVPAQPGGATERELRAHLELKLPRYMMPNRIWVIDRMPEHASGKVDRVALARLAPSHQDPAKPGVVARNVGEAGALQRAIADVWREVLGADRDPNLDENFFDAGGDSLRLLTVHARLQETLCVKLSIMDMFQNGTIRKLAAVVRGAPAP